MTFTKKKFLQLKPNQQHRQCSDLLRGLYGIVKPDLVTYNVYLDWMQLTAWEAGDHKSISDRYHYHLNEAGLNLKEHNLLPIIRTGDRVAKCEFPNIAIYLDHVRSAYNVGSILRTTEALRVGSVHFSSKTPFIDNEKVYRTAMGAAELVPCFANATLDSLPKPIIILDTSEDAIPVSDFIFPPSFTLVLGNEEYGVSDASLKQATYNIEVPMLGAKNSLNIACAFAIAAAEIRKQIAATVNS
jgi:tRNA G18 (ribose-2'-O)-methylase SpoU